MSRQLTTSHTIPIQGGIDEVHEKPNKAPIAILNDRVQVSMPQAQNVRPKRNGVRQRGGCAKHHSTTAHTDEDIRSIYGFSKGSRTELALFAQYEDGSVEKGTDNPPSTTTGNFGTSVLAARSGASPATWANFKDHLLYADGAGQAQIYTGEQQKPILVNVYKGSATIPDIPEEGADYTNEVKDGLASTVVVLDSLDTLANNDALFIGFDTPMNKITFTVSAANGNASVATVSYRKNDSTWASASATDGTASGGASVAQTGSFTWTLPTDEIPHYAFGKNTFLYRITFSAALDAEVEVSNITGENTAGFQNIQNMWDGVLVEAVEAVVEDVSTTPNSYYNYSSQAIKPGEMASGDYLYFNSQDPILGFYLDVGKTPNTTASTAVNEVAAWTGSSWTAMSSLTDGTGGGANSGYVTWAKNTSVRKLNFNSSQYHAYWYRVSFDKALSEKLTWAIMTMPYFDINNIYPVAQTVTSWDRRTWISFDDNQLHGSAALAPMTFNGDDYVGGTKDKKLYIGDHRTNKILCTRRFYNFLLVWQEEKGREGGCFSIVEPGATAAGYSSQIISPTLGILNSQCAVVLEDVNMSDINREIPTMTGAFFVSGTGVYKSNGSFVKDISGGIANYFDPSKPECIRRGYEGKHFLEWDSLYKVMRLGLVSGSSATKVNKWFLLDPTTNTWLEDVLGQSISCLTEVEAASGNIPILQYAGCQDGYVRRVNTGNQDDGSDIISNVVLGLNGQGHKITLHEVTLRCKTQASGNITQTIAVDGNTSFGNSKTLSMTAYNTNDSYRAHRYATGKLQGSHFEVKIQNATSNVPMELEDIGFRIEEVENNTVNGGN